MLRACLPSTQGLDLIFPVRRKPLPHSRTGPSVTAPNTTALPLALALYKPLNKCFVIKVRGRCQPFIGKVGIIYQFFFSVLFPRHHSWIYGENHQNVQKEGRIGKNRRRGHSERGMGQLLKENILHWFKFMSLIITSRSHQAEIML